MNDWHVLVLVSAQGLWWYSLYREMDGSAIKVSKKCSIIQTACKGNDIHIEEYDAKGPDICRHGGIGQSNIITTLWRMITRGMSVRGVVHMQTGWTKA